MSWELAQVKVARLTAPLDAPLLADSVTAPAPLHAAADGRPSASDVRRTVSDA